MALSGFEIAIGGITSIPVTGGLIFLGYKAFGEKNLDASKFKPKKPAQAKKAEPTKVSPESKKVVEVKKDTDSKKNAVEGKSATIKKSTAKKKPIDISFVDSRPLSFVSNFWKSNKTSRFTSTS